MPTAFRVVEVDIPLATAARVTDDELIVELSDGRTVAVPLSWYPRLAYGTPEERSRLEVLGEGIRWPLLDEDISVKGLIFGTKSDESARSLERRRKEMDRRRREGDLDAPWGQELPLPEPNGE